MHIRKNAASLTDQEWEKFMGAVIALKHSFAPGSNISVYDQFVAIHWGVTQLTGAQTRNGGHGGPAFLAWHREYIRRFEAALRSVDPEVTLPYWNWALGELADTTSLFRDERIGPMGNGGASALAVDSGYLALSPNRFHSLGWSINADLRQLRFGFAPEGNALERNTTLDTGALPTASQVNGVLMAPDFSTFRPGLESAHNTIHILLGRDMSTMTSPNDLIFFLHHCQVDRLWAKWQKNHPGTANYNPLGTGGRGHRLNDLMWPWDGRASQTTVTGLAAFLPTFAATDQVRCRDVVDHHSLEYCYDDEPGCPCGMDEEEMPTRPLAENIPTTLRFGEEGRPVTTLALGEEGRPVTTLPLGEEGTPVTTLALGEEGTPITIVENGPLTAAENAPDVVNPNPFGRFPGGNR